MESERSWKEGSSEKGMLKREIVREPSFPGAFIDVWTPAT